MWRIAQPCCPVGVQEKLTHAVRAATSRKGRTPHRSQASHDTVVLENLKEDLIFARLESACIFCIVARTSFE